MASKTSCIAAISYRARNTKRGSSVQVLLTSEHLFAACDSVSLVKSLGRAAEDSKSRPAALDSLTKLHHIMGPKFQVLLASSPRVAHASSPSTTCIVLVIKPITQETFKNRYDEYRAAG